MKVLMISGDRRVLEEGSEGEARVALQRSQVERLDVVVWPQVHSLAHIFRMARRGRYDVITAQDPLWRGHVAHHLCQLFGARLNIQVHADLSTYSSFARLFVRSHLRRANSIRVVSEKIKKQVAAMGVKAPIHVLPVFVDVAHKAFAAKKSSGLPSGSGQTVFSQTPYSLLWLGRFEKEKDPLAAIEVFKKVHAVLPEANLVMLGAGSLAAALRAAATGLPVDFPGWQAPARYFERASLVLSTSPSESYGASIVEALAAGVPVVALDVGVAREAGAIITSREKLAEVVIEALTAGARGELKLALPTREEWARAWKETLI